MEMTGRRKRRGSAIKERLKKEQKKKGRRERWNRIEEGRTEEKARRVTEEGMKKGCNGGREGGKE